MVVNELKALLSLFKMNEKAYIAISNKNLFIFAKFPIVVISLPTESPDMYGEIPVNGLISVIKELRALKQEVTVSVNGSSLVIDSNKTVEIPIEVTPVNEQAIRFVERLMEQPKTYPIDIQQISKLFVGITGPKKYILSNELGNIIINNNKIFTVTKNEVRGFTVNGLDYPINKMIKKEDVYNLREYKFLEQYYITLFPNMIGLHSEHSFIGLELLEDVNNLGELPDTTDITDIPNEDSLTFMKNSVFTDGEIPLLLDKLKIITPLQIADNDKMVKAYKVIDNVEYYQIIKKSPNI